MKISSILRWVLIFSLSIVSHQGFAQTDTDDERVGPVTKKRSKKIIRKKRIRKAPQGVSTLGVDWLNGGFGSSPNESSFNPNNAFLKIPDMGLRTDLILDYRHTWGSRYKFVARPRGYLDTFQSRSQNPVIIEQSSVGKVEFLEVFGEAWLTREVSFTLGLQNYQWGPAEIISPSNPIFHFNRDQRSLLWREGGHALARLNWTPSVDWSHVLIVEGLSNQEPSYIGDRPFVPKVLLKSEVRDADEAQNYLGLIGGTEEESRPFGGLYFSLMPIEGFSLYGDFRMTERPFRYTPQATSPLVFDMLETETNGEWQHVGVFGLRLETESLDMRAEVISNPMGFSEDQFRQALQSALPTNPRASTNLARLNRPGLELYAKTYGYFSIRAPDIGNTGLWQASLRYLHSGLDQSGIIGVSIERNTGDHFILLFEGRHAIGKTDAEFTLQEKYYGFFGVRTLL